MQNKIYTQQEIQNLIEIYDNTDKSIIKENTQRIINNNYIKANNSAIKLTLRELAERTGLSEHTLYMYNKHTVTNYPNFYTALKLANFLDIDIMEFIK